MPLLVSFGMSILSGDSPLYTNRMKIRHANFEQLQWYSVSPAGTRFYY